MFELNDEQKIIADKAVQRMLTDLGIPVDGEKATMEQFIEVTMIQKLLELSSTFGIISMARRVMILQSMTNYAKFIADMTKVKDEKVM